MIDSQFKLGNKYLVKAEEDFFYHFGFGIKTHDIPVLFGDVKFVCCGGSPNRSSAYAARFAVEMGFSNSGNLSLSDRYVLFKTGPVLWVNHGIGGPSLSVMLVEMLKLIHHAKAVDVTFFRLGTSGGVGVEPGTVVVTSEAINGGLESCYVQHIAGKKVIRPTVLDEKLSQDLLATAESNGIPAIRGKTLCADDFYEGQMRLDGFFCEYQTEDKFTFLRQLNELGVRNIEMESTCFASYTCRAGVKAGIVCVALLNRMQGDSIEMTKEKSMEFEERPYLLVSALMRRELKQ